MNGLLRVAVVGGAGYAGGELVRLLAAHPDVTIASIHARDRGGAPLGSAQPHLAPLGLELSDGEPDNVDVAFLALPHGASAAMAGRLVGSGATVIDIGADFRLRDPEAYATWYGGPHPAPELLTTAVYGLTEWSRDALRGARLIANPGCYPTASLLALTPFARDGLLAGDVIVDAKSGISGAGRSAGSDYLFTELTESTRAYGLSGHRHQPEIAQGLALAGAPVGVTFVPHLVPQSRGLLATCYLELASDLDDEALKAVLADAYEDEPFVHVTDAPPATKLATGSNHAFVHARRVSANRAVVLCAIDNLGKGAAGQAIQNMNVALGLEERAGIGALGVHP
ncbi:MAG: N-acetyl-gamma-glutamyl-phosphate reductase [Candidatus Limnocylindria bacterium]